MKPLPTRAEWAMWAVLSMPLAASAQEYADVTGRIVDGETGGPVTAAAVQVVGRAGVVDLWLDAPFQSSSFYRRERLFARPDHISNARMSGRESVSGPFRAS